MRKALVGKVGELWHGRTGRNDHHTGHAELRCASGKNFLKNFLRTVCAGRKVQGRGSATKEDSEGEDPTVASTREKTKTEPEEYARISACSPLAWLLGFGVSRRRRDARYPRHENIPEDMWGVARCHAKGRQRETFFFLGLAVAVGGPRPRVITAKEPGVVSPAGLWNECMRVRVMT